MRKIIIVMGLTVAINAQNIVNTIGGNTATDKFIVENKDSEAGLIVTGDGHVGVGTTADYVTLNVDGLPGEQVGIKFNGVNSNWASIYVNAQTPGATPGYGYLREGYLRAFTALTAGYGWVLSTGEYNDNRLIVDGDGNVGVGTMIPTSKFHLYHDDTGPLILRIDNPNPNGTGRLYFDAAGDAGISVFGSSHTNSANALRIFNNRNSPEGTIDFVVDGQTKLIINETGAVGIGEDDPKARLEVNGKIKIDTDGSTPEAGQIRYLGGHFEGYNGTNWIQLDN